MSVSYSLWILAGLIAAFLVRRLLPTPDHPHRRAIWLVALLGAVGGSLALEVPADVLGWTAGVDGSPIVSRLGGRTVLGGLLGGWLAVEAVKPALGVRVATGDGFAAPLAVALAFGRLGCLSVGCCAGRLLPGGGRWPVQAVEALFHGAAAVVLVLLHRRGAFPGRLLAGYVVAYAVVRFALEAVRANPVVLGGLTYYQVLTFPLLGMGLVTLWRRRDSTAPSPPSPAPTVDT
jgi:phosphatidylglycerol:prolipoprotein diacylglycerol transferase